MSPVNLTDGGMVEAGGEAKLYDGENAWFSINHSMLYACNEQLSYR
jgi:hypothetical protein